MLDNLKGLLGFLVGRVRALPPAQLFILLGVAGSVVALGLVGMLWMTRDADQNVLYSQLTVDDAAAITDKLTDMGVAYTLRNNGTTIMVPSPLVHDTRLRLATEGLPRGGGVGFELFDQRNFGMTEFMQKLNYRRALQGELSRTITQIDAVLRARVHIALPEKSLFLDQQDKTTASVVLTLAPGRTLNAEQIHGITHLVASSVEGLQADEVTLVDSYGKRLDRAKKNIDGFLNDAQLGYQRLLEHQLENRVQSLLERAVGKDKVLVRVSATLDFQHVERSEERYDADNPAIRSEQRSKEAGQGAGFWALGVPGTSSNVTNAPQQDSQAQRNDLPTNTASRESETINYEVSKVVSKMVAPSGKIKRLSVAVLVDGKTEPGQNANAPVYVPRSDEEIEKYRDIVKGAIGYDEARGDRVEITNMAFEIQGLSDDQIFLEEAKREFWLRLSRYGVYVILGLLVILFAVRPMVKSLTPSIAFTDAILPRTVHELESDMQNQRGLLSTSRADDQPPDVSGTHQLDHQTLRMQAIQIAKDEPEQTAEILRLWLKTGRGRDVRS